MHAVASAPKESDRDLADRAGAGDLEAFAALYERHFDDIYDFTVRTTGRRDRARKFVEETFANAWRLLRGRRRLDNPRAGLYAIARTTAVNGAGSRREITIERLGSPPRDELSRAFTEVEREALEAAEGAVDEDELTDVVWRSAAAFNADEYSLLDLHVRRGLSADELADALGLDGQVLPARLDRLMESIERSAGSTLLMRLGWRDCPALDALLNRMSAVELTPEVSREIEHHLARCDTCRENRRRYGSPVAVLPALARVEAPEGVRDSVWQAVSLQARGGAEEQARRPLAQLARWWSGAPNANRALALVAATLVATAATTAALALVSGGGDAPTGGAAASGGEAARAAGSSRAVYEENRLYNSYPNPADDKRPRPKRRAQETGSLEPEATAPVVAPDATSPGTAPGGRGGGQDDRSQPGRSRERNQSEPPAEPSPEPAPAPESQPPAPPEPAPTTPPGTPTPPPL